MDIIPSSLWDLQNLSKGLCFVPKLVYWGQHAFWWQSPGRISDYVRAFMDFSNFSTEHGPKWRRVQWSSEHHTNGNISWEFSSGQLHPKSSPMVMSTWRNRSVLRVCPAIPSEGTEFSAFSLVSFGRKENKKREKKKKTKNILTTWFLDLKRINANQFSPWHLLFYILKPITYSVY